MAFKFPLPVVKKIICREPDQISSGCKEINLPNFNRKDFSDITLIGQGSFGKVFRAIKNSKKYVIKQLLNSNSDQTEKKLFWKEAEILNLLKGHANIVEIKDFSISDFAILMDYIEFSFLKLQIEHDSVSTLSSFMRACDNINDYQGFEHLQNHIARDICCGLKYLHVNDVAHRDLKPDNVLVSNDHYINCEASELERCWLDRPIWAKLTDFGESRSMVCQTKTISNTSTVRLFRGSPAYMIHGSRSIAWWYKNCRH